jgi:phospholipase/lecithinase/hemolysin
MTGVNKIFTFRQNCVAVAVAMLLTQSVYALQDLSDSVLSATTGEGVALLPENFKMVFQGPNDVSAASSYGALTDPVKLLEASKKIQALSVLFRAAATMRSYLNKAGKRYMTIFIFKNIAQLYPAIIRNIIQM